MGKKQHQGTYDSSNEYAWSFGGKKAEKLQAAKGMGFRTVTHPCIRCKYTRVIRCRHLCLI